MASRTISNTASELLPENPYRRSFVVQNEDGAIDVFVKQEDAPNSTVSTTDHDHRLAAGASLAISNLIDGKKAIVARWTIISASGTPRISVYETEDIER